MSDSAEDELSAPGSKGHPWATYALFSVLALLPIVLLGVFIYRISAGSTRQLIFANNLSAATLTRELVEREIGHHVNALVGFSRDLDFIQDVALRDENRIRQRISSLVESFPPVVRAFVTAPDGTLWSDYPRAPESLGRNFSDREWFKGVTDGWKPYVSPVYRRNAEPRVLLVAIAVPIRSAEERVIGIVVYQIRLEALTDLLRRIEVGHGGFAFLLDHTGAVAAHPRLDLQAQEYPEYAATGAYTGPNGEAPSTLEYDDPLMKERMLATSLSCDIRGQRWVVVAQQPVSQAYAPIRLLAGQITAAGTFSALALLVALAGMARYQIRIRHLNLRLDAANRKLAVENLERRRRFRTLVANLPGIAYRRSTDPAMAMEFVSEGCGPLTGYPPEALIQSRDRSYADLIHPEDRGRVETEIRKALAEDQPYTLTYRIRTADGTERWVWEQGRGAPDPSGSVPAMEGFITDISQQKSLEQQLIQAQKMEAVGRLAGGVAHDFNNLLTVIDGYSDLLLDDLAEGAPGRAELEEIHRAGERAASLTRQLLAFSRRQVMIPEILDLNTLVAQTDKMLRRLIGEDIELFTHLREGLGHVKVDPGQVEQIILNLAVNARDAMPDGGQLTIETDNVELDEEFARNHAGARAGSYVMIAMTDTGQGMDAGTRARIFEPFFTTKSVGRGTGLGLSTVYGIVKQSDGYIWVYSEPGRGSSFKVYFPLVEDEATYAQPRSVGTALDGKNETVLLVEDEDGVRSLVRNLLERHGYRVRSAAGGPEAIEIIMQDGAGIDVLLTDLVMPGMDGRELADRLKTILPGLRIVYMSGYTEDAIIRHGAFAPGTYFIEKPIRPTVLLQKLRECLG